MPRRRRPPRAGALADASPLRILSQIIILQIAYYICAAVLIVFATVVAGKEVNLDLVLSWRSLRSDITVGWMLGLLWMLNSLVS
jgi:protein SYS1